MEFAGQSRHQCGAKLPTGNLTLTNQPRALCRRRRHLQNQGQLTKLDRVGNLSGLVNGIDAKSLQRVEGTSHVDVVELNDLVRQIARHQICAVRLNQCHAMFEQLVRDFKIRILIQIALHIRHGSVKANLGRTRLIQPVSDPDETRPPFDLTHQEKIP